MTEPTEFAIHGEYIQLDKLLKACGLVGTGGEAKRLVQEGYVRVDGEIETRRGRKIRPGQRVEFEEERIEVTGDDSEA